MKNNRGISLIELAIVIIILIIIAGLAVFSGKESVDKAEVTEIFAEVSNIKNAVNGVIVQMNLEEKENDSEWLKKFYDTTTSEASWYEIYGMDKGEQYYNSNVRKNLDMDTIKRSYKVNFTTGDVKLSQSLKLLDTTVSTYDEIRALAESDKI